MRIVQLRPRQMKLAFDFEECATHVTDDVRDELAAHSREYQRHEKAIQSLEFSNAELTDGQVRNQRFFLYDLSKFESIVCDWLWACGIFSAFQVMVTPNFSPLDFLTTNVQRLYETEKYVIAFAGFKQSYRWLKASMPKESHDRLEKYRCENLRGLRLIAIATVKHGFEFGIQIMKTLGMTQEDYQADIFYDF